MGRVYRIRVWLFYPVLVLLVIIAFVAILGEKNSSPRHVIQLSASSISSSATVNAALHVNAQSATATSITAESAAHLEEPDISTEIAFFYVDVDLRLFRFVALVSNRSMKTVEGLTLRWDALDADGVLVGSHTSTMPALPARSTFSYVGGAGEANLSGVPNQVKLTVVNAGRLSNGESGLFTVDSVELNPESVALGGKQYRVTANITTRNQTVQSINVSVSAILKDAAGRIVGADFDTLTNLPPQLPANTKFRGEVRFIRVTTAPVAAEMVAYAR